MPKKTELKCYFGCPVDGPLHRFPKWEYPHEEKFKSWKSVLSSKTQEYDNNYIYNNVRLCYRQFEKYFQLPSNHLTRNAVPTLHLSIPENLQDQAMETITATLHTCHSTPVEPQAVDILSNPAQEQVVLTTASTSKYSSTSAKTLSASHPSNVSIKERSNRGIGGISLTTSYKRRGLAKQIDMLKETITKLRNKCKSQTQEIRMAEKISRSKAFLKVVEEFPEPMKIFVKMQLKHKKKPRGRKLMN